MPSITNSNVITGSSQILDGIIGNADVASDAAIAYSKLNLSGGIVNADVNASAAIAYSKLNLSGGIVNADVNASAAIADTKLATISTAGKVSGAALTSLSSIPAGAGQIPSANIGAVGAFTTGSIQLAAADTERTQQNIGALTEIKRIKISNLFSGVVSVYFEGKDEVSGGAEARIYVNSVATGTLRQYGGVTSYTAYTEDITVAAGDIVQLYWGTTVANKQNYVKNFRVRATQVDKTMTITD